MNADELTKILDELGQRLGPTGEHVFQLAVRQIVIDGIASLVIGVSALAASIVLMRWLARFRREDLAREASKSYYTTTWELAYMLGGIGLLVLLSVATLTLWAALSNLLNPEYAALRGLLGAIHP